MVTGFKAVKPTKDSSLGEEFTTVSLKNNSQWGVGFITVVSKNNSWKREGLTEVSPSNNSRWGGGFTTVSPSNNSRWGEGLVTTPSTWQRIASVQDRGCTTQAYNDTVIERIGNSHPDTITHLHWSPHPADEDYYTASGLLLVCCAILGATGALHNSKELRHESVDCFKAPPPSQKVIQFSVIRIP